MVKLSVKDHIDEVSAVFKISQNAQTLVICWQQTKEKKRTILPCVLSSFTHKSLSFMHLEGLDFELEPMDCYFYFHHIGLLFKSENISVQSNLADFLLPESFIILKSEQAQNEMLNMVSKSEELSSIFKTALKSQSKVDSEKLVKILSGMDKMNTLWKSKSINSHDQKILSGKLKEINLEGEEQFVHDLRRSPRSRPRIEKFIRLSYLNNEIDVALFDLSQGGLSFVLPVHSLMNKGDVFTVLSFDDQILDVPLKTKVVNLVDIGDQRRACCQFLD